MTDGRLRVNTAAELELPTIDESEKRYLDAGQIRGLADAAGDHRALVLLLGFTGLRFGEAAALTVRDVDLVHGRVRVHRSVTAVDGRMVYLAPKSHQARTVPLPRFLVDAPRDHLRGRDPAALPSRIRAAGRWRRECSATMVGARGAGFRCPGRAVSTRIAPFGGVDGDNRGREHQGRAEDARPQVGDADPGPVRASVSRRVAERGRSPGFIARGIRIPADRAQNVPTRLRVVR